jgi:ubiquinone/menaquinone biosynthesis C-methylase UbiE
MDSKNMKNNKELYEGSEFANWAYREDLIPEEQYLIDKYLSTNLKTVEAGTAGGKIPLAMAKMGFTDLHGFDYVAEFIETAKERDKDNQVDFQVQDATQLLYDSESFDQIIYLQQIISSIDNGDDRSKALLESYRILKPGGIGLFSFLSFEVRSSDFPYSLYIPYLKVLRSFKKDALTIQHLPWMKLDGKFNQNSLLDRPPYTYWYMADEISNLLEEVGFQIVDIGSTTEIKNGLMKKSHRELDRQQLNGMLYVVVTK